MTSLLPLKKKCFLEKNTFWPHQCLGPVGPFWWENMVWKNNFLTLFFDKLVFWTIFFLTKGGVRSPNTDVEIVFFSEKHFFFKGNNDVINASKKKMLFGKKHYLATSVFGPARPFLTGILVNYSLDTILYYTILKTFSPPMYPWFVQYIEWDPFVENIYRSEGDAPGVALSPDGPKICKGCSAGIPINKISVPFNSCVISGATARSSKANTPSIIDTVRVCVDPAAAGRVFFSHWPIVTDIFCSGETR